MAFGRCKESLQRSGKSSPDGDPQVVLRRRDAVVVVAQRDYEKLTGKRLSFKQFLLGKGPTFQGLDLQRNKSPMRKVKL